MKMMDRVQQQRIFATLKDISLSVGQSYPELRKFHMNRFSKRMTDMFKKDYWGDQEGELSLKLGQCTEKDATLFYYYLIDIALKEGIELDRKPT